MTSGYILQYHTVWSCFPAQVCQFGRSSGRSTVQFRDVSECVNVQALFASQVLKAQTHPAMLVEGEGLLLTLSRWIQKLLSNPRKAT